MSFSQPLPWRKWSKPAAPCSPSLKGLEDGAGSGGGSAGTLQHQADLPFLWKPLTCLPKPPIMWMCRASGKSVDGRYLLYPQIWGAKGHITGEISLLLSQFICISHDSRLDPFVSLYHNLFKTVQTFYFVLVQFTLMWFLQSSLFYGNQMFCQHFFCYVHQLRKPDAWVGLFNVSECCFCLEFQRFGEKALFYKSDPWCTPFPNLLIVLATAHILIWNCSPSPCRLACRKTSSFN